MILDVESSTRPFPIDGTLAEASFYWVNVDVIDGSFHGLRCKEVPIKPRAFLPETKTVLARSLTDSQVVQQWGSMFNESLLDGFREWLFDPSQQAAYVGL